MLEKRRHRRVEIDLPVILRHGGRLLPATMLNLSCGGMLLRAEGKDISSEGPVEVIFDLGEYGKDLSMRGRITRMTPASEEADMGVQFTNLFSVSHKAIQEYLRKNLN
ncbi:MAG TPA: PilZ domain-containing protein [bacterium]|nr:PilZ domain-containing protein [bacterium]